VFGCLFVCLFVWFAGCLIGRLCMSCSALQFCFLVLKVAAEASQLLGHGSAANRKDRRSSALLVDCLLIWERGPACESVPFFCVPASRGPGPGPLSTLALPKDMPSCTRGGLDVQRPLLRKQHSTETLCVK
jgi:hypothetical protein